MAGKKRTTFAKLNREQKIREKRVEKQMRKESKKLEDSSDESSIAPMREPDLLEGVVEINPDGSVVTS